MCVYHPRAFWSLGWNQIRESGDTTMNQNENDLIARRIAQAPEPFRVALERLHKRGLLTDPAFRQRFLDVAKKVAEEEGLILVQKPPQNRRA